MDGGPEAIDDDAEERAIRAQARRIQVRAAVGALLLSAGIWLLP